MGLPPETAAAAVDALRLRYRLLPYLYSAALTSARTGVPMLRALLVDTPDDPAAWNEELTYRLGDDLLVAPMTDPAGSRDVYLPTATGGWTGGAARSTRAAAICGSPSHWSGCRCSSGTAP